MQSLDSHIIHFAIDKRTIINLLIKYFLNIYISMMAL
jgi:hypothetical protein